MKIVYTSDYGVDRKPSIFLTFLSATDNPQELLNLREQNAQLWEAAAKVERALWMSGGDDHTTTVCVDLDGARVRLDGVVVNDTRALLHYSLILNRVAEAHNETKRD